MSRQLSILSFLDIQKMQREYNIPFTCSISTFIWKLINALRSEGEEEIELTISCDVIPKTYRTNPWSWVTLILRKHILFYAVRAFRNGNQIILKCAGQTISKRSFKPLLFATLQKENRAAFPLLQIPFAYKKQPYYLVSILRKQFPSLKVEISKLT